MESLWSFSVGRVIQLVFGTLFMLMFLGLGGGVTDAHAEVSRTIRIDSAPPGAEVFLLRGSRREAIGKTPLRYRATFHSEMSILRILIRKPGFADKKIEISAKDKRILAKLMHARVVASADSLRDKSLRPILSAIRNRLERVVPRLLKRQQPYPFNLDGPLSLIRLNKTVYLHVPVVIDKPKSKADAPGGARPRALSATVWRQLGNALVLPLAKSLKTERRVGGVFLDVNYSRVEPGFKVGVRTQTRVEMECVGGTKMKSVYDSCASREAVTTFGGRYLEYRCKPGYVTKPVYDPCASRVPVTRTEFKADPRAVVNAGQSRLRYLVDARMAAGASSAESISERVGLVILDNHGKVIRHGVGVPGQSKK